MGFSKRRKRTRKNRLHGARGMDRVLESVCVCVCVCVCVLVVRRQLKSNGENTAGFAFGRSPEQRSVRSCMISFLRRVSSSSALRCRSAVSSSRRCSSWRLWTAQSEVWGRSGYEAHRKNLEAMLTSTPKYLFRDIKCGEEERKEEKGAGGRRTRR